MKSNFVFINMATKDVAAAREFYSTLGFEINTAYSTENNVFIVIAQNVQLILGEEAFFKQIGESRDFVDATKMTEASIAMSAGSIESNTSRSRINPPSVSTPECLKKLIFFFSIYLPVLHQTTIV